MITRELPTTENALPRRRLLIALGLLPIAAALSSDTKREYHKSMDAITPHVTTETREITAPLNLIKNGTWLMEGATIKNEVIVLKPTNLHIRNKRQEGEYSANPPVNLYGTHLYAENQFSLSTTVRPDSNATISLRLYAGSPPLRFDDFSFLPTPELECQIMADRLIVNAGQGDSNYTHILSAAIDASPDHTLQIQRTDTSLQLMLDGMIVGEAPRQLLDGNDIWLGFDSNGGETVVSSLTAYPLHGDRLYHINTGALQITQPTPHGLQTLIDKDRLLIGTGASLSHLVADERYAQVVLGSEFGIITPENGMKPQDVQPAEGMFTFAEADALVDAAARHGLQIHGHTLMFDKAMPAWMQHLPYETDTDKQRLMEVLWAHIYTITHHFRGKVASWDVWNELVAGFNNDARLSQNPFTQGLGEQAIDIAFLAAHNGDPAAKLFINDYGLETNPNGRGRFMFDLLARAKDRGVPIDGLGIQGHVYEIPRDYIKPHVLKSLMKKADDLDLDVRITELDITGSRGEGVQAKQYAEIAKVCAQATNCTAYTVWGPADMYGSTISVQDGKLKPGNALLYDASFRPKPARTAIAQVLQKLGDTV